MMAGPQTIRKRSRRLPPRRRGRVRSPVSTGGGSGRWGEPLPHAAATRSHSSASARGGRRGSGAVIQPSLGTDVTLMDKLFFNLKSLRRCLPHGSLQTSKHCCCRWLDGGYRGVWCWGAADISEHPPVPWQVRSAHPSPRRAAKHGMHEPVFTRAPTTLV